MSFVLDLILAGPTGILVRFEVERLLQCWQFVTRMAPPPRPWFQRALVIALVAVALLIAMDRAYLPTFRLYLDQPGSSSATGSAQLFGVEGNQVVPAIVTRQADRVAFVTEIGQDATLQVGLRPQARANYAIEWRQGASHRVLAQGTADQPMSITCAYPTGTGVIELVSDAPVTWVDPRAVRNLPLAPYAWALGLSMLCLVTWCLRDRTAPPSLLGFSPLFLLKTTAVAVSLVAALVVSEVMLRALGERLPRGIAAERHDLGEVNRDPHWVDSPRYGRRLRASVDTLNEWRDGDIVRMGFVPSSTTPGPLHRYSFHTDREGFRNPAVRDRIEIAALGDSFTDALTMGREASWPARLEDKLGVTVQNYGTAGFGPQQELMVLQDYVVAHRPRTVVLAFFAGNDLFDAEAFDAFQRSGGTIKRAQPGWRIKDVVSPIDTWFVVNALRAGQRGLRGQQAAAAAAYPEPLPEPAPLVDASPAAPLAFDRGWFDLAVAGRRMRWAFMPPYLNTLNYSRAELTARPGWRLTTAAIREMQAVSRSIGAEFVVMFVPFKSQAYLPLIATSLSQDALRSAFGFYLASYGRAIDVNRLLANRLAQNQMMAELCADAGIALLDTTPALAARAATGENVYFPDESHLNQAGEALIAEQLAAFLQSRQKRP